MSITPSKGKIIIWL